MNQTSVSSKRDLLLPTTDWRRLAGLTLPFAVAFGAVLTLEMILIARIDQWMQVDSFQTAARNSLFVSAVGLWIRLCIVGAAVFVVLRSLGRQPRHGYLKFWCGVSLVLTLSFLAVDYWSYRLQFGDGGGDELAVRAQWLATLYARLVAFYVAVRLLLGASRTAQDQSRLFASWSATTTLQSFVWFSALLLLKLTVDGAVVEFISYIPVVSPFWFIPNELSPMRYFVGNGVEIVAQSCGVFFYVAFWTVAARWVGPSTAENGSGSVPEPQA